jgi:Ni/Fe-hydrogenase subunit HybB-like protein
MSSLLSTTVFLGKYWWAYAWMMSCNVLSPQLYWFKPFRRNLWITFILSIFVNIGMWFERFVIIVTSLADDFLPSSWNYFTPTWVDMGIYIGSIGLFMTLVLVVLPFLPGNRYCRGEISIQNFI